MVKKITSLNEIYINLPRKGPVLKLKVWDIYLLEMWHLTGTKSLLILVVLAVPWKPCWAGNCMMCPLGPKLDSMLSLLWCIIRSCISVLEVAFWAGGVVDGFIRHEVFECWGQKYNSSGLILDPALSIWVFLIQYK